VAAEKSLFLITHSMLHHRSLDGLKLNSAWTTIGSFDGVHRGHQVILNHLVRGAHTAEAPSVVVTFYPHPAVVLRDLQGPFYLTTPDDRAAILADIGIDHVVTLPFNHDVAALTAEKFMEMLHDHLGLTRLVVGNNFALGRGRSGDIHTLRRLGEGLGYEVEVIPPVLMNDQNISSTRIRELISIGQVSDAAVLLGRWYRVSGKVVHGDGRGRLIGIPTANVAFWPEQIIPERGVYACLAWIHNKAVPAVTNIGLRPTFEVNNFVSRIETHLLDFNEDLYDMDLKIDFIKYLRPEKRFPSADALIEQIHIDIQKAREVMPYVP